MKKVSQNPLGTMAIVALFTMPCVLAQQTTLTVSNRMTIGSSNLGDSDLEIAGKTGSSAVAPSLRISGDGGVIFSGTMGTGSLPTTSSGDAVFVWFPKKAAFVGGGGVNSSESDLGLYSFAFGNGSVASGEGAVALGHANATGDYAVALGYGNATGNYSVALGAETQADGDLSIAIGQSTYAPALLGIAMGNGSIAGSSESIALGSYANATGSLTSWVSTDPLLVVGNGNSNSPFLSSHNAFEMLKNGKINLYGTDATTPVISLDPDNSQIKINGQDVLTSGSLLFANSTTNRVGVGTNAPNALLDVKVGDTGKARISRNGEQYTEFSNDAGANGITGYSASTNPKDMIFSTGGSGPGNIKFSPNGVNNTLFLSTSGNVGIGLDNPNSKLNVKGVLSIFGNVQNNVLGGSPADGDVILPYGASLRFANSVNNSSLGVLSLGNYGGLSNALIVGNPNSNSAWPAAILFTTSAYPAVPAERMRIDSSGNVGIGTQAPNTKLSVQGAVSVYGSSQNSSANAANGDVVMPYGRGLRFTNDSNNDTHSMVSLGNYGGQANSLVIGNSSTTSTWPATIQFRIGAYPTVASEKMRIDSNGNVGIGSTDPLRRLEVTGTSGMRITFNQADQNNAPTTIASSSYLHLGGREYGANSYRLLTFGYNGNPSYSTPPAYIGYQEISTNLGTWGDLIFGTRPNGQNSAPVQRMRITSDGLVKLFGTSSPTTPTIILDPNNKQITVDGEPLFAQGSMYIGNNQYLMSSQGDDGITGVQLNGEENAEYLAFWVKDGDALHIDRQGNVGIANSNPDATLDVNGNASLGLGLEDVSSNQVVVGKYNDNRADDEGTDHTEGVFVVGAGAGTSQRKNAMRVLDNGTILVQASGDIPMGEFINGPQP